MQKTWRSHLLVAYSLAILAFLYLPLLILAMYSFNESRINAVWTGFTFNWYAALFQNRRVLEALTNSLFIAVISTIASTTLGTIAAIALSRYQYKYKPVINGLLYLPILIPEIVMGLSLLVLFAQAQVPLGKTTLILAHITFCTPYVVLSVLPRLKQMNPNIYEAALDLGATPMQALRKVIIPEIRPGMISGFMLALTLSIDDFAVTVFTIGNQGLETLSTYIYADARKGGLTPELRPLSAIIFVVVLALLIVINYRAGKTKKKES